MLTGDVKRDCAFCSRQDSQLEGKLIYEDDCWRVRHSSETNILGYAVLESRRHFLDLSQANPRELKSFGPLLSNLTRAIRLVTDCRRVYSFSLAEMVPHFHLHLIPRSGDLPKSFHGRGIMSYPIRPAADDSLVSETCYRLRRALKRSDASQ